MGVCIFFGSWGFYIVILLHINGQFYFKRLELQAGCNLTTLVTTVSRDNHLVSSVWLFGKSPTPVALVCLG